MHDPMAPIRAEVLAQPEPEQVEYALDLMAYYLAPLPAFYEGCADMGLALANSELRMLHAMDAKRGRYVSLDALLAARCVDAHTDDWPSPDRVVSGVAMIRRRLEKLRLPVEITTWRGVGYCLEAPNTFRFEEGVVPRPAAPAVLK
ncbi:helix-turn-helix domain-containing protein [Leisingera sp. NJS201]|uniref:helix-turn-helix domain-containing protein n=1 Tax=Leisingera sp. NJS201 TaxID=2508306 RepID=UPI001070E71F|nr:helix-turn-helix domain-containing protein [Leisingera sp. NJS201]QBR35391.1 helix-turn-helix domain-containing protein [Leisingera sp. NJS201]